jgi:hypothetical protein
MTHYEIQNFLGIKIYPFFELLCFLQLFLYCHKYLKNWDKRADFRAFFLILKVHEFFPNLHANLPQIRNLS